jgi:hypothetical protein
MGEQKRSEQSHEGAGNALVGALSLVCVLPPPSNPIHYRKAISLR